MIGLYAEDDVIYYILLLKHTDRDQELRTESFVCQISDSFCTMIKFSIEMFQVDLY